MVKYQNVSTLDSHEKWTKSTFNSASARRSLHEASSALLAQKGDALSGVFPIKSVYFLSENSIRGIFLLFQGRGCWKSIPLNMTQDKSNAQINLQILTRNFLGAQALFAQQIAPLCISVSLSLPIWISPTETFSRAHIAAAVPAA